MATPETFVKGSQLPAAEAMSLDDEVLGIVDGQSRRIPRKAFKAPLTVPDLPALRGLTGMQDGQATQITSTGRAGLFRWDGGDLKAECDADPQMGIYVPPTGQDGSAGAWVRQYNQDSDIVTRPTDYESMVDKVSKIAPIGGGYWFRASASAIEIGSRNAVESGSAYRLAENEDGFMHITGAWCAPMEHTGVPAQATNLVGDFVTPTTTPNHFATTPGDTFELPFDGHSLEFYFYSDDRGGVWQITLDGGAQVATLSTWSAAPPSDPPRKIILFSGLDDGPHTAVFEFLGDDPDHVPSGGVGTSRGWFRETYSDTGLGVKGVSRIEQTGSRPIMLQPISVVEFAIFAAPVGSGLSGGWVPRHGVDGSTRDITRRIYIDGVLVGSGASDAPEYPAPFTELVIQQAYTAYNINDMAGDYPMWSGVLTHKFRDGVLTITHQCKALNDFEAGAGYLAMFPGDYRFASSLVTASGERHETYLPPSTIDISLSPVLSAAFVAEAEQCAIACDVSGVPSTLRRDRQLIRSDSVFLQLRTDNVAKVYWKTFNGDTVQTGERFGSVTRLTMLSNDPSVDFF